MTVQDLIDALQQFDPEAKVEGTWEGITQEIDVYLAADGRVLIDADLEGNYKVKWQKTPCAVCGEQAVGTPFEASKPVCAQHWEEFCNEEEARNCQLLREYDPTGGP